MNIKTTTYNSTIIQPQLKAGTGMASEETQDIKKQEKVSLKRELDHYVQLAKKTEITYANRIEEIKRQLKEGTYQVSADLIADAMLYQMSDAE